MLVLFPLPCSLPGRLVRSLLVRVWRGRLPLLLLLPLPRRLPPAGWPGVVLVALLVSLRSVRRRPRCLPLPALLPVPRPPSLLPSLLLALLVLALLLLLLLPLPLLVVVPPLPAVMVALLLTWVRRRARTMMQVYCGLSRLRATSRRAGWPSGPRRATVADRILGLLVAPARSRAGCTGQV